MDNLEEKFKLHIGEAMNVIETSNVSSFIKGEYFGYFLNRIAKKLMGSPTYAANHFNSIFFIDDHKKILNQCADAISNSINFNQPLEFTPDLVYVSRVVYTRMLEVVKADSQKQGFKFYLKGIIGAIKSGLEPVKQPGANHSDYTISFRKYLVMSGILDGITQGV